MELESKEALKKEKYFERLKQGLADNTNEIDLNEGILADALNTPPSMQKKTSNIDEKTPFFDGFLEDSFFDSEDDQENQNSEESLRVKSSLRMFYEAQTSVIKKQLGTLENVRGNLGLSQRKMAQLLMVDPSAWTRWTKKGDEAPPHVWRALQWYMIVQDKIPGLTSQYFIGKDPEVLHTKAMQKLEKEAQERKEWGEKLQDDMNLKLYSMDLRNAQLSKEKKELEDKIFNLENQLKWQKKVITLASMASFFLILLFLVFFPLKSKADPSEPKEKQIWFPVVFYTPETGVAGGALNITNLWKEVEGKTSNITSYGYFTQYGQSSIRVAPKFYFLKGTHELFGAVQISNYPNKYYGTSVLGALDEPELYKEKTQHFNMGVGHKFIYDFFLRISAGYENKEFVLNDNTPVTTAAINGYSTHYELPYQTISLDWDDRDYPQAPKSGSWYRWVHTFYQPHNLSGDAELSKFQKREFDLRKYLEIMPDGILGVQLYYGEVYGDKIPISSLMLLGGANKLRGFYEGRFRDKATAYTQIEFRKEWTEKWSWALFGSVGRLAENGSQLAGAQNLSTGGFGFHYFLDKENRTKLRMDFGFSQSRPAFYFIFGEAF